MSKPSPEFLVEFAAALPPETYAPMAEMLAALARHLERRAQEEHLLKARRLQFAEELQERCERRREEAERPKFEKMRKAMQLAATGLKDQEIADEMGESKRTVQRLIQAALRMRREPPAVAVLVAGEPVIIEGR